MEILKMSHLGLFGFVCFFICINFSTCLEYLKDQPSLLIPCKLGDPNNSACWAKALQNIFADWIETITGFSKLDPYRIKELHLQENNQNINLKIDLADVILTGLSKTKILKGSIKHDNTIKYLAKQPSLNFKGKYRIKGNILLLNMDIAGSIELEASDVVAFTTLKSNLVNVNQQKFFNVTNSQVSITTIGNIRSYFRNTTYGSPDLIENANMLFNQNWRDIFELSRPAIEETISAITFKRTKKIFRYIPANFFVADLS